MLFLYLTIAGVVTPLLGWFAGSKFLFPFMLTAPAYVAYYLFIRRGRRKSAVAGMLLWAIVVSITFSFLSSRNPSRSYELAIQGEPYTKEMVRWIRTGEGREGNPSEFVPRQTLEFVIFLLVSLVTGGFGGLLMGSVLLLYMNCYAGTVVSMADNRFLAAILAWPPWAMVGVVAFVVASVPMSEAFFSFFRKGKRERPRIQSAFMFVAIALIVIDMAGKALLAPVWRALLMKAMN